MNDSKSTTITQRANRLAWSVDELTATLGVSQGFLRKLITRIIIQILPYGQGCWKIGNTREEDGNFRRDFYQGGAISV